MRGKGLGARCERRSRGALAALQLPRHCLGRVATSEAASNALENELSFFLISSSQVFPLKHYQDKIRPYIQLPSHRNITGVVEVILGDTKAYVFFEKDFGDMHSYVRSCKRLREEEAARLFKQIVSAVAHCHQSAIVLGDLKLRKFVFSNEER